MKPMELFDLSEAEFEVKIIEPVEDDEYDGRIRAVVKISHPELETIVTKYHVWRGLKHDEMDEILEGVQYHINPEKRFDPLSLVHERYISFELDESLPPTSDALIDGVRALTRSNMHATAELDLTDFGDRDTFLALLNKHELRYGGIRTDEQGTPYHEWASINSTNLVLRTISNPVDGEHLLSGRARDPGCASYCTIIGEVPAAKELIRDILRFAHVKGGGVDRPLTTDDGRVFPVKMD